MDKYIDQISFFSSLFLFRGIPIDGISDLLADITPRFETYKKGETVFSREVNLGAIGFVRSGECDVLRLRSRDAMPLNTLRPTDSFGVLSLFGEIDAYPTQIVSQSTTSIVFFDKSDIVKLTNRSKRILENLLRFLADRILFLNHKVAILGSTTVTEKLSKHLLFLMREHKEREFNLNLARLSDQLSCGRASLYRAIDELCTLGYIHYDNKKIKILSPDGLERM